MANWEYTTQQNRRGKREIIKTIIEQPNDVQNKKWFNKL